MDFGGFDQKDVADQADQTVQYEQYDVGDVAGGSEDVLGLVLETEYIGVVHVAEEDARETFAVLDQADVREQGHLGQRLAIHLED